MIKKIFNIIIIAILLFTLCACDEHYDCHVAHVIDSNGNCVDIKIDVYCYTEGGGVKCYWNDYRESALFPNGTYVLFKDKCLICNKEN